MHARELAELAAVVATHLPGTPPPPIGREGLSDYWNCSRERIDQWDKSLRTYRKFLSRASSSEAQRDWAEVRPLLEEILASDILTRVWAGLLSDSGRDGVTKAEAAIGRSVFAAHQEMRGAVLAIMAEGPLARSWEVDTLNLLRRACERWTDVLLARISRQIRSAAIFAYIPQRVLQDAKGLNSHRDPGDSAWKLLLAAFRSNLAFGFAPTAASSRLNSKIAAAVLASIPESRFDSVGLLRSTWQVRLDAVSLEASQLVSSYLQSDAVRGRLDRGDSLPKD